MKTNKTTLLYFVIFYILAFVAGETTQAQIFTKITEGPLVNDDSESVACSWGDYDNDGDEDLFVSTGIDYLNHNFLFRNEGPDSYFIFTPIETGDIVTDMDKGRAASWGDYDNDGDLDIYLASQFNSIGYRENFFYQNLGNGTFKRITEGKIVTDCYISDPGGWIDYDQDGFLDIFVGNPVDQNTLYHNEWYGNFTRIKEGSIATDRNTGTFYWGDYDNDGDQDLLTGYWNRDDGTLFINNGNGDFTIKRKGLILDDPDELISDGNWVDYDNDGDWDIASMDIAFYRNEGADSNYLFRKVYTGIETDNNLWSLSNWADIDNDGDIDCYVTNGEDLTYLYLNDGAGTFTKVTEGDIVTDDLTSIGSAWADYDQDGDMDLYVCNRDENNTFYRNDNDNSNSWVKIKLNGTVSNAAAIGSIIKVKANTGVGPVWQMRAIEGQSTLFGQNSLIAHFGLGTATNIDSLVVLWPVGHDTVLADVAVDTMLTIIEEFPQEYLRANFLVDTIMGKHELTIQFTDTSLVDPDNPITSWSWDFNGDGIEDSNEQNPVRTFKYSEGKVYNISLAISNGKNSDTLVRENLIKVYPLDGNQALWGKASASSEELPLYYAQKAIDGNIESRWNSDYEDAQWLKVELDSVYILGKVIIHWESAYAKEYYIRISSNDTDWDTVSYICTGDGDKDTLKFTGTEGKYVMIDCIKRGTPWGNSIYELEIFKSDGVDYGYPWENCGVGIENNSLDNGDVSIYPNPAGDELNIEINQTITQNAMIDLIDITGKLIYTEIYTPGSHTTTIKLSGLAKGIYLIKISTDNNVFIEKFVKN